MKRLTVAALSFITLAAALLAAQARGTTKPLEIYIVDPEGGKEALWVTPAGQALLIDTGSPGGRDTDRIMEAINDAGVKQLDFLLSTHYHIDHVGGLQELVKRIPVAHFLDHGPTVEDGAEGHQREQVQGFQAAYAEIYGKAKHTVLKPGDRIPLTGLDWRIVTSAGKVSKTPLPGGGKPNPECAGTQRQDVPRDPENGQSVGSVITFGQFRAADFGDLTWDIEHDLMCPTNPIGTVDVYFVSNHGINVASSPELVHAIQPRVAIMQNSAGKGNSVEVLKVLRSSPGLEDIWQLHWGNAAGAEWNSAGAFIANGVDPAAIAAALTAPPRGGGFGGGGRPGGGAPGAPGAQTGPGGTGAPGVGAPAGPGGGAPGAGAPGAPGVGAPGAAAGPGGQGGPGAPGGRGGGGRGFGGAAAHTPAYWIKITVQPDGTFTVLNSRNGFSKTYVHRAR